eukprot:snap_masked-scaffold_106-processed-gene-0.3-mRNA-1 protein AED:1.00 eAED:1.00 QI:0/0/0/0/1/1/2/0/88
MQKFVFQRRIKKVYRELGTLFVGCNNHRFELVATAYIKSHVDFDQALDKVWNILRRIKKSKRLTEAIRNFINKAVILPNVSHWSGFFL